ncbi:hypothetical protein J2783_003786 [Chryseobacterium sediminis]|nr:hypothetical protein [Chryseobacterium sediminis]
MNNILNLLFSIYISYSTRKKPVPNFSFETSLYNQSEIILFNWNSTLYISFGL